MAYAVTHYRVGDAAATHLETFERKGDAQRAAKAHADHYRSLGYRVGGNRVSGYTYWHNGRHTTIRVVER